MMKNTIIKDQIAQYERRAERMYSTYDDSNTHWKRVVDLYFQQQDLFIAMSNLRADLLDENLANDVTEQAVCQDDIESQLTLPTNKVPVERITTASTSITLHPVNKKHQKLCN